MTSNLTEYVSSYGLPKVQIHGLISIYESVLKELPGKPTPLFKDHRKSNHPYLFRYGETLIPEKREVFLH